MEGTEKSFCLSGDADKQKEPSSEQSNRGITINNYSYDSYPLLATEKQCLGVSLPEVVFVYRYVLIYEKIDPPPVLCLSGDRVDVSAKAYA
jgi:hypothetical protein